MLKDLGYEVPVVIRKVKELEMVIKENPFTMAEEDKRTIYVTFLGAVPEKENIEKLQPYISGDEEMIWKDRDIYLLTPGYGNTKLTIKQVEGKLGTTATARNWNTINKMVTL